MTLDITFEEKGAIAEVAPIIPTTEVDFELPKANVVFANTQSVVGHISAKVTDLSVNPDSQNRSLVEILTSSDFVSIGSNKSFTELGGTFTDSVAYINTAVNKVEPLSATEALSRTVTFFRNFADNSSPVDANILIKPGIPINGEEFNAGPIGWEFFGTRDLVNKVTKGISDTSSSSESLDHNTSKVLADSPVLNDSISVTLDKDSTVVSEGTATDEADIALQTYFVMNGAMLNNRPIN